MTLTQCPDCAAVLPEGARSCGACGWKAAEPGTRVLTSDTPSPGTGPHDKTLLVGERDILLERLREELAADYEVESELGRGGMAVVYRAVERELHRVVALKVLPPGMGGSDMAERFRREARMAAALDHQHIIPVFRVGQAAGTYFFAMKFVEGRAVDAIVEQQGALPVPVVLQILRASASALAFAHDRGIVHRDIKGANILVDRDGRVMVSDFGIARAQEEKTLTASGSVIGTPHFMSPEQCAGQKVGPQSDQYSLGALAFQLLTGSVPFDADGLMAILQHHFFTPVPDIAAVREGVPAELIAVVNRALAKEPEGRYASTRDMLAALESVPFPDAERRQADELLKQLAVGTPVPRVRTGSLPPLPDARRARPDATAADASSAPTVTAAAPRRPPPAATRKPRSRLPMLVGGLVLVAAAGGGAVWQFQRQAARALAVSDSLARDSVVRDSLAAAQRAAVEQAARDSARLADSARGAARPADPAGGRRPPPIIQASPPRPVQAEAAPAGDPGFLRVSASLPNADIAVDGRRIGQGMVIGEELAPGRHRLRITAPGCTAVEETFTIASGQTQNLGRKQLTCAP